MLPSSISDHAHVGGRRKLVTNFLKQYDSKVARKLVVTIIAFSSLLTLVATVYQLVSDYRDGVSTVHSEIEQIYDSQADLLRHNIWNLDVDSIQVQLDNLLKIKGIEFLSLKSDQGTVWQAGQVRSSRTIDKSFSIHQVDVDRFLIGELTVVAGLDGVVDRIYNRAVVILVSNAIKTLFVAVLAFVAFHYLVTRHLAAISSYLARLESTALDRPLQLDGKSDASGGADEIDQIVSAINLMRANLRREIEQKDELDRSLRRSQKMDAVGQLSGGIAHDFNNMLGVIIGNLENLKERVEGDPAGQKAVAAGMRAALRSADLTKRLLNFSRKVPHAAVNVRINGLLRGMEELIARALTSAVNVELVLASGLWDTVADPGDLEDALLNLAINARDAMPEGGGLLLIETANKVLDEHYAQANPDARAGEYVMLTVSDNGSGMSEAVQDRIFEPFFSTKDVGKGTGLGLAMVFGFVQRSGGHVKIYSEPGAGTTFRIYLPRARDEADSDIEAAEAAKPLPRGEETILVVDDEPMLVDLAVSLLEGLGYRTLSATDGPGALKVLRDNRDIDLLFSDIIMASGMDGYQLATAALGAHPELKVLLTSGFSKKREAYLNKEAGADAAAAHPFLDKPYNRTELALAIRSALDTDDTADS